MNRAFDDIRKEQYESLNQEAEKVLKENRFLLLRNYESLDVESKGRLEIMLQANKPLFKAHVFKDQSSECFDILKLGNLERFPMHRMSLLCFASVTS